MSEHRIQKEAKAARVLLENLRDVIGNDIELALDTIEGETRLFEIIDSTLEADAEIDAMISAIDQRIADLNDRKARFKARKAAARGAIAAAMETIGEKSLVRPCGTISLAKTAKKVEIVDEQSLPSEYWKRAEPKIDRSALLAALKIGSVPGAALVDGGTSLRIRSN